MSQYKNTTRLASRRCYCYCLAACCIRLNISPRFSQSFTWGELACCRFWLALTCRFYKALRLSAVTSINRSPITHITLSLTFRFEKYPKTICEVPPFESTQHNKDGLLGYGIGDQALEPAPSTDSIAIMHALNSEPIPQGSHYGCIAHTS
jgi:hypothetical protein